MCRNVLMLAEIVLLCIAAPLMGKAQKDWELIRKKDGIAVYLHDPENQAYYEIKALTKASASTHALVALLKDAGRYDEWMHRSRDARLLEVLEQTHYVYYLRTHLPWPVADKDMVVHTVITPHADGTVSTLSRDTTGYVTEKNGVNRLHDVRVKWHFRPIENGQVHIRYYTRFNPGIAVPEWLEKQLFHTAPYQTLLNLKKQVQLPRYTGKHYDFLHTPD